jgi:hypothetical protein
MKRFELLFAILLLTGIGCISVRAQMKAEKQGWYLSMQSYTFSFIFGNGIPGQNARAGNQIH